MRARSAKEAVIQTAPKRRIALFIPSLSAGGSERQLVELAKGMCRSHQGVLVVTMYESGELWAEAAAIPGVELVSLSKRGLLRFLYRLITVLRAKRVGLVLAFLDTAQLYSLFFKFASPRVKLVYRVGDSRGPRQYFGMKQMGINVLLRAFARVPAWYIVNSNAARTSNAIAIPFHRLTVVHNGIDTDRFQPHDAARGRARSAWGMGEEVCLIGCLATFSVHKDHATFVEAAKLVHDAAPHVQFLTIGDDSTVHGQRARDSVRQNGLESCFRFLGRRTDAEVLLPACDIGCSSSITEGFPNAICEFMSCGVPCVVTDVGDSAAIVADTGRVVPKSNARALADSLLALVNMSREDRVVLGLRARRRIVGSFAMEKMVNETTGILDAVLATGRFGA